MADLSTLTDTAGSPSAPMAGGASSIPQLLRQRAQDSGSELACLQKRHGIWQAWDWQALAARVGRWAAGLRSAGLAPGLAVGIVSGGRVEALVAEWACLSAGLVPVVLNPHLPPGALSTMALEAEVRAFILEDQEQVDKVADQQTRLPALQGLWVMDPKGTRNYRHIAVRPTADWEEAGTENSNPQDAQAASPGKGRLPFDADTPSRMRLFTGGAVSETRVVEVDLDATDRLRGVGQRLGLSAGVRCASLFGTWDPMGHFVSVMAPLLYGTVCCFGEGRLPNLAEWRECAPGVVALPARALDRLRADSGVRAQRSRGLRRWAFERWQAQPGDSAAWHALVGEPLARSLGLGRCARVLTAYERPSPAAAEFLAALRMPWTSLYVLAEAAGPVGQFDPAQPNLLQLWPQVQGAVGHGGLLQLQLAGSRLDTGDLVERQTAGYLHRGRAADQLSLPDGQRISPVAIEAALLACPYAHQVVVVGGPAQGLTALVELDEALLREWARSRGLVFTTTRSIAQSPAVRELLEAALRQAQDRLPAGVRIARTLLLPRPLDAGNGELSPSMAVRRAMVRNRYAHRLIQGAET